MYDIVQPESAPDSKRVAIARDAVRARDCEPTAPKRDERVVRFGGAHRASSSTSWVYSRRARWSLTFAPQLCCSVPLDDAKQRGLARIPSRIGWTRTEGARRDLGPSGESGQHAGTAPTTRGAEPSRRPPSQPRAAIRSMPRPTWLARCLPHRC
jgi:hypothetical protein